MVEVPTAAEHANLAARLLAAEQRIGSLDAEGGVVDRMLAAHATAIDELTRRLAALEQARPGPSLPQVAPVWSESLRRRCGINMHPRWGGNPDGHVDAVRALALGLRVRMYRDRVGGSLSKGDAGIVEALAAGGMAWHATVGTPDATEAQVRAAALTVKSRRELFTSVGGVNEPNATGTGWPERAAARQRWIWAELGGLLPVCGPALKDNVADIGADFARLGATGIASFVDFGDFHRYPRGLRPGAGGLAERQAMAVAAFGGKPSFMTEIGYNTSASGVSEQLAAVYAPRAYLDALAMGIERAFTFELLDRETNPLTHAGHFGLVACPDLADPATWRPKASYHAVRTLMEFLADDGPAYVPPPVGVTVDGPPDLRTIVTGRSDGSAHVIVWRDCDAGAPAATVTVQSGLRTEHIDLADRWTVVKLREPA